MPADRKTAQSKSPACILSVQVVPRSSRLSIERLSDGIYKIKLTAPPVEGAANEQLIEFLANVAGVPKKNITIIRGAGSRKKVLQISGVDQIDIRRK